MISETKLHEINKASCEFESFGTVTPVFEKGSITKIEIKNVIKNDNEAEGFIRFLRSISNKY
jgi:hypothetical protein